MIEPILSLAMSMHANPGVYAILVGSGVSRSAKIPTGWEIVLDFIRKLATMEQEDCEPDPAAWYHKKFGRDPDYSELLDAIGKSPSERQQLLRSHFEPNEEEREQGFKQPTPAHRAIAKLVAGGYCRVILTTNFDRLIERAIEDEGVSPIVISTPDAVEGAVPLVHQRCCVVKLHGDYLDTRIRNTPSELSEYDDRLNRLLDQIFDSFGLIVCGWSTQWDSALRAAIERCPTRRFTTYWTTRSKLGVEAQRLASQRSAQVIQIEGADSFFVRLAELIAALEESQRPHPASVQAAVALTKRYLSDHRHRIELEDLVVLETESAHKRIETYSEEVLDLASFKGKVEQFFCRFRAMIEVLQAILIQGAAFGSNESDRLWLAAIERISRYTKEEGGRVLSMAIRQYPTLVLLQGSGLVAMSRNRYESVVRMLTGPTLRRHRQRKPLLLGFEFPDMHGLAKTIEGHKQHHVPLSEHLFDVLREPLRRLLPDDLDYDECFDRFEYVRALAYADLNAKDEGSTFQWWIPPGRFCWKYHRRTEDCVVTQFRKDIEAVGAGWPLLKVGLFGGSLERAKEVMTGVEGFIGRLPMY